MGRPLHRRDPVVTPQWPWVDLFSDLGDHRETEDALCLREFVLQVFAATDGRWVASVKAYENEIDGLTAGVSVLMSAEGATKAEALTKCVERYRSLLA